MPFTETRFPVAWASVTTAATSSREAAATTVRNMAALLSGSGDRWGSTATSSHPPRNRHVRCRTRGGASVTRSCHTGGGDLISERQEHRAESEGFDPNRAEDGRAQHGGGLVAQLAAFERPAPGAPDGALEGRDAGATRRRDVLDRHEPATWPEHATYLGDDARRLGHRAEDERRADQV